MLTEERERPPATPSRSERVRPSGRRAREESEGGTRNVKRRRRRAAVQRRSATNWRLPLDFDGNEAASEREKSALPQHAAKNVRRGSVYGHNIDG